MALVDVHIARLAEDGRSVRTLDTYRYTAGKLAKFLGGWRLGDATAARVDAAIRSMKRAHGPTMARQARTVLRGALQLAVMANVLGSNPVRDVEAIKSKAKPKGAAALTGDQLRDLLSKLRASTYCRDHDLVDPIMVLIATGLRRSELLGLRWLDFDEDAGTLTVSGKVVRVADKGLERIDDTKTDAGKRTIPLPGSQQPRWLSGANLPYLGEQPVIFPSSAGTLRGPDNFGKQWRAARDELGVPGVTTHSFRRTVATLIDEEGLSAPIGADHLGHSNVSMTQDRYMARGRVHAEVAGLLDRTVAINDE
jgi:integrase